MSTTSTPVKIGSAGTRTLIEKVVTDHYKGAKIILTKTTDPRILGVSVENTVQPGVQVRAQGPRFYFEKLS